MSGDVEAHRPRPLSGGLWSLLSWLRRDDPSLSIESLSSIGSDRTTASFAFLNPEHYRFGNKPTVLPPPGPPTDSYKKRVHDRNLRFKYDNNITLHRKYGLHKSQESIGYDTFSLPPYNKSDGLFKNGRDRRATSEGFHRRTVHVPGKRRAPLPPTRASSLGPSTTLPRKSRKRPAPLPPPIDFQPKNKENQKVNSELPMNNSDHVVKSLNSNSSLMELKPQKYTKIENNAKENRSRSEKNFLKHIFENKKRHSVEISSLRVLPSISELDKQAAEIIKNGKLNFSQSKAEQSTETSQNTSNEMWICTKCFRKYKASIPKCLNCTSKNYNVNEQCTTAGLNNVSSNAANIYTQTDIAISSSSSKNNKFDEKQKLKEMLKEMKDSLPKKPKQEQDNVVVSNNTESTKKTRTETIKLEEVSLPITTPTLRIGSEVKEKQCSKLKTIHKSNNEIEGDLPAIVHKPLVFENIPQEKTKPIKTTESFVTPKLTEAKLQNEQRIHLNTPMKISLLLNPVNETKSETPTLSVVPPKQKHKTNHTHIEELIDTSKNKFDNVINSSPEKKLLVSAVEPRSKVDTKASHGKCIDRKINWNESNKNIGNNNLDCSQNNNVMPTPSTSAVATTSVTNNKEDTHIQRINHHLKRRELINQLEKSIASGDEQAAADAAVKLAQLRLSCSVLSFSSQIVTEAKNKNAKCNEVTKNSMDIQEQPKEQIKINILPTFKPMSLTSQTKSVGEQQSATVNSKITEVENKTKEIEKPNSCSASSSDGKKVKINIWVEDKEATRGPIHLNVGERCTLADLRKEAEKSFGIQTNLQRWIIGRTLCTEDNIPLLTLAGPELKAPFYLCLVKSDKTTSTLTKLLNKQKLESATSKEPEAKAVNVYNELMQLEQQSLIANTEAFECGVCMEECGTGRGVILRECVHSFCRECLADVIRHSEEPDVSCPAMGCRGLLQEREIRTLVTPEDYEKWLARGLAAAENGTRNSFHCRTRDCSGWALCEPGVRHFPCPVCKKINCVPCQSIHEGETCEQHRAKLEALSNTNSNQTDESTRALLLNLIKKGEALECPECKAIITKKWGCDWIKCSACKTEICWVTRGRRWGPTGRGDTSAGCRCGVDGKRCHPSCGYCH